jgi:integrase/recombinase XerD
LRVSTGMRLYLAHKRSMGWQFREMESFLITFSRAVGDVHLSSLTTYQVSEFLAGPRIAAHYKYDRLKRFFQYWRVRGQLDSVPLPSPIPRGHSTFVPYIYSRTELRRMVSESVVNSTKRPRVIDPATFRTLLVFLYGTGVLLSEALTLRESALDLRHDVMTVQRNAHARKRTIPIGSDVHKLLTTYLESPIRKKFKDGNLFLTRKGTPVHIATLNAQFRVIRRNANVVRLDGIRFQPRLHDLRSTFVVHRIAAWYEQGLDGQELLPALGAYLGQLGLISMNRHLSLTPEHYRKHLATASGCRDSRKRGSKANPLTAEFFRQIQNS